MGGWRVGIGIGFCFCCRALYLFQFYLYNLIFIWMICKKNLIILFLAVFTSAAMDPNYCDIANCRACSYFNFCGACENNYILSINSTTGAPYCEAVTCDI